jgi:hypothetical protein
MVTKNRLAGAENPAPFAGGVSPAALVSTDTLAALWEVSTRQIQLMTARGILPCVRIGRRCLRYDVAEATAALDHFKVRAAATGRKARAVVTDGGRA